MLFQVQCEWNPEMWKLRSKTDDEDKRKYPKSVKEVTRQGCGEQGECCPVQIHTIVVFALDHLTSYDVFPVFGPSV